MKNLLPDIFEKFGRDSGENKALSRKNAFFMNATRKPQ